MQLWVPARTFFRGCSSAVTLDAEADMTVVAGKTYESGLDISDAKGLTRCDFDVQD